MKKREGIKLGIVMVVIIAVIVFLGGSTFVISRAKKKVDLKKQLSLGEKYLDELNYDQAILVFKKAIEIDDKSVAAYLGLARAYKEVGKLDKAVTVLQNGYTKTSDRHIYDMICKYRTLQEKEFISPAPSPTVAPTLGIMPTPSQKPTVAPTTKPSQKPTITPTAKPSQKPMITPTASPTAKPTPKPTIKPTVKPTVKPTKSKNELAHEAYIKMLSDTECRLLKKAAGSNSAVNKISRIDDRSGVGISQSFDYTLYVSFLDLNGDQVDELLFGMNDNEFYFSDIVIFQYKDNKVQSFAEIPFTGLPIFTRELLDMFDHNRYIAPFDKPKPGQSLLFFNSKEKMLYSGNYISDQFPSPMFDAMKIRKNGLRDIYSCSYYGMDGDEMFYSIGSESQDVSKQEYDAYYKKHFANADVGERVKFYFYDDLMKKHNK